MSATVNQPKVSVAMITYQHEAFIAQAIESVLRQQTPFPVELVIGEDCSTDGTREIVQRYAARYPEAVRPLLARQNLGMHENLRQTLSACRGQYVAFLEGDDYWTSPQKLERQVAFLDAHPEFVMCYHRVRFFLEGEDRGFFEEPPPERRTHRTIESLLNYSSIATCSVVCRRAWLPEPPVGFTALRMADWPLWMLLARHGDVGFVDELMAEHRFHDGGIYSSLNGHERLQAQVEVLEWIANQLPPHLRQVARAAGKRYAREARVARQLEGIRAALKLNGRARQGWAICRTLLAGPRVVFRRPFAAALVELVCGGDGKDRLKHWLAAPRGSTSQGEASSDGRQSPPGG